LQKKHIIIFLFFSLFQLAININAQSVNDRFTRTKKLLNPESLDDKQVFLKAKVIDSTKNINVFLINKSIDTLKLFSLSGDNISFEKEVKDVNGNWVNFDEKNYYRLCLVGSKTIIVPRNYYTYEIYKSDRYTGNYDTELRFKYKVNDSLEIKSNILKLRINKNLLIEPKERIITQVEKELELNSNISKKEKRSRELFLIKLYNKYQKFDKSIILTNSILKKNPDNDRIRFMAANSVLKYLTKYIDSLNIAQKNILLSKVINDFKKVSNIENGISKLSKKYIKHYKSQLLSTEEWIDELKKDNCLTIKNSCKCHFNKLFSDCIEILYYEKENDG